MRLGDARLYHPKDQLQHDAGERASKQRLNHADFEHWARLLTSLGHHAKLIAPEVVRRFVKKGKRTTPLTPRRCARPLRGPT
jgi:transposase